MKPFYVVLFSFAFTVAASAQLTVNVDPALKMYWLSGSASGTPYSDPDASQNEIFWDNQLPFGGDEAFLLSLSAFTVTGNSASRFVMVLESNGNINGVLYLQSGAALTLAGNPAVKFSYANYSPALVTLLESKASSHEVLPATEGSASFGMNFQMPSAVPEPSAVALLIGGGLAAGATIIRRRQS